MNAGRMPDASGARRDLGPGATRCQVKTDGDNPPDAGSGGARHQVTITAVVRVGQMGVRVRELRKPTHKPFPGFG
jgi:hypothetical protein